MVITTALVPGRPAPRLVTAAAVAGMKPGSVVVDLAGETGGNCELTEPGEVVVRHGVTIAKIAMRKARASLARGATPAAAAAPAQAAGSEAPPVDAGYLDPAGNHVPETHFVVDGPAWLFHGGRIVRATWHKSQLTSILSLKFKGKTITVPAGHVWVELVPAGPGNVTWQK